MLKRSLLPGCLAVLISVSAPVHSWARPRHERASAQSMPTIIREVVYGHKAGMALTYDVLKPAHRNGAAIIHIVSGGWISQWASPESLVDGFREVLDRGFTMVVLYHGSQPQFAIPEATADIKRGLRYFRLHAGDYGVDPHRIGVWGKSAGGQLALVAALMGDEGDAASPDPVLRAPLRVRTAVAYYPPSDVGLLICPHLTAAQRASPEYAPELYHSISPVFFVDPADPPVLIIHGDADTKVDVAQSRRLHEVLDAAHVENRLIVLSGAGHGFKGQQAEQAGAEMLDWFSAHLDPEHGRQR